MVSLNDGRACHLAYSTTASYCWHVYNRMRLRSGSEGQGLDQWLSAEREQESPNDLTRISRILIYRLDCRRLGSVRMIFLGFLFNAELSQVPLRAYEYFDARSRSGQ